MPERELQVAAAPSAAYRSQTYALLAAAFRYPTGRLCQSILDGSFQRQMATAEAGLPYQVCCDNDGLAPPATLSVEALKESYTRSFDVGSFAGPPCCLYEGEYGGGRMGVMRSALRFYHFFGLRLSSEDRDRPDHLATQLEFLHWLTFQEARGLAESDVTRAQSYRAATRDFLSSHVRDVTTSVANRLEVDAAPFYSGVARLASRLCAQELEYLQGEGEEPRPATATPEGLSLQLCRLREYQEPSYPYDFRALRSQPLEWDRVVKASHLTNCGYQTACNFNLFVSDGVVIREEQVGNYPAPNDSSVPDYNPRGCNKGACYVHRTYDPARIKYPLKRVGARGEGRWQRVSWDQALTEIADQLIDVLITDGPDVVIQGGGTRIAAGSSEAVGINSLFDSLGAPLPLVNTEIGDGHLGSAITMGKIVFGDSADNWFHSDIILVWGGNPVYTNIPNYHYIVEARYKGTKVVTIAPDFNPSTVHADLWVPLKIGTDAALCLGICQVIVQEGLLKEDFVREQTDLPLLVRVDDGKFLREKDLKRGGRDDAFYVFDEVSQRVVEAPRRTLALNGLVPALRGEYEVRTLQGIVRVRPVFAVLRERLDRQFTPKQASELTGVPMSQIEQLARELASARGVVNITTYNWGKFYHGDLIERAMILIFALCGHLGHKGASFSAFAWLAVDTGVGAWERQGQERLQSAAGSDPRYAAWKEDGYTPEMMLYEYVRDTVASGALSSTSMVHLIHGGLAELSEQHQSWDPDLKRPLGEYVAEALAKNWQPVVPAPGTEPRVLFEWGGDMVRRARATNRLLATLLPKLQLIVTVDWRMSATGLQSDYVLPACGWYERSATKLGNSPQAPFVQVNDRAIDPLYESLTDWAIAVRLARTLSQRARDRGVLTFRDRNGKQRRLDRLEDAVTAGGLYAEDDEGGLARDTFVNALNHEEIDWEEFKSRGIASFTGPGTGVTSVGNACDITVGEPVVPLTWHVVKKEPWPTLTRRMQFYIDHDWYLELDEQLPTHKDSPRVGGDYPLQVTGGHARWSIHTDWIDNSIILGLQRGEPAMFMSVEDASAREVQDGDFVEVFNDIGSFRIQAVVSPAVRPGQVIIYHAWENYQFQGWRHFKNTTPWALNPIQLIGDYSHLRPDAMTLSPGPNDRDTRVEVRKTN